MKSFLRLRRSILLAAIALASAPSKSHAFQIGYGGNWSRFSYTEEGNVDSENGWLGAQVADFRSDILESTELEIRYYHGSFKSNYVGSTLATNTPITATTPMIIDDYESLVKQNLDSTFYLFAGLGYHKWEEQCRVSADGCRELGINI